MKDGEKENLIMQALQALGERCSFHPNYKKLSPESIQAELEDDIDARLEGTWPGSWPGQQVVELDNVGDAGLWLSDILPAPASEVLFGIDQNDEDLAESMTEDYLQLIRSRGFPLPSDFGDDPVGEGWTDEDEAQVRADFLAFLQHWRERVLVGLEKQNQPSQ
jgi:hypothetical protein